MGFFLLLRFEVRSKSEAGARDRGERHARQRVLKEVLLALFVEEVLHLEIDPERTGNTHAGPNNPQLIEVTRDKQVVWTLKDFKNLGNATAATQVLGVEGKVIR